MTGDLSLERLSPARYDCGTKDDEWIGERKAVSEFTGSEDASDAMEDTHDGDQQSDAFLKGIVLKVIRENKEHVISAHDYCDFLQGLKDFLASEEVPHLISDPEVAASLGELRQGAEI